jgi:hypothetical protein
MLKTCHLRLLWQQIHSLVQGLVQEKLWTNPWIFQLPYMVVLH